MSAHPVPNSNKKNGNSVGGTKTSTAPPKFGRKLGTHKHVLLTMHLENTHGGVSPDVRTSSYYTSVGPTNYETHDHHT